MQASDFQLMPLFVFLLISLFDRNTVKISFPVKIFLLHNSDEKMEPVIQKIIFRGCFKICKNQKKMSLNCGIGNRF